MSGFLTAGLLLTWLAIVLLSFVVAGLVRHVHRLSAGHGPAPMAPDVPAGALAPGFNRLSPPPARALLLLFLSNDCSSCAAALAELRKLADRTRYAVRVLFPGAPMAGAETCGVPVYAHEAELFDAYGVPATPFAVVVEPSGHLRSAAPVGSAQAVRALLLAQPGTAVPSPPAPDTPGPADTTEHAETAAAATGVPGAPR